MRLLLDTHIFIWWDSESSKLSPQALALCQDRANTVLLSVASIWEMQIKLQLGKLRFSLPLAKVIESQGIGPCIWFLVYVDKQGSVVRRLSHEPTRRGWSSPGPSTM